MADDAMIGRLFDGRYRVTGKLGSGGMADVYLAEDQELGRKVALKMLNERHARDEQFVERFRREAQNAAGLGHPNIVQIFDRGQAEGTYYIAMEYLDGPTLKELLVKHRQAPIPTAIEYARQILEALAFAHRHGIIHRDIKPHNIVFGTDRRLKVTDFGIARSGASQMTEVGSIVGTAQYLSPEQARGAPVDPRSDIYSLGIVLYELLTGKVPFSGDAAVEIAMKHLSAIPDLPSKIRPEVPHDLDAIVMRALAKEPDQRYQSAEEMAADLERVSRGAPVSTRTDDAMTQVISATSMTSAATMIAPGSAAPPVPPVYRRPDAGGFYSELPKRRKLWPWLLGLLAIAILAVAGFLLYNRIQSQITRNTTIAVSPVEELKKANAISILEGQGLKVKVKTATSESVPAGTVISQAPSDATKVSQNTTVTIVVSAGKPKVTVPMVIGFTRQAAISTLVNAGLNADPHTVPSSSAAENTVVAQSPDAKDASGNSVQVTEGSTVRINVSTGPKLVEVPGVLGDPIANAKSQLAAAGFAVTEDDVASTKPVGSVIGESPAGGSKQSLDTKIVLTVSSGPKNVQVPYVVGDSESDAEQAITAAGLQVTVTPEAVTAPEQSGLVLDQNPAHGSLKQGATVVISVGQLVADTTSSTTTGSTTTGTTTGSTTTTPPPVTP